MADRVGPKQRRVYVKVTDPESGETKSVTITDQTVGSTIALIRLAFATHTQTDEHATDGEQHDPGSARTATPGERS